MDLTHVIAERENKKIYRDGAKAIKVFAEGYSKADILNEALNTARVEETGLPIPKLLAVDTVNGQWAITTEFVEGDTLAALMAAHPEKEDEYLNLFVDIQMKVHACTCPMLNSLTEKMQRKISATDLDATTRYELHTRLATSTRPTLSSPPTDSGTSSTGRMPRRATRPLMLPAPTCSSSSKARKRWRRSTSPSSARRATPPSSTSSSGFRSSPRASPSRASPKSATCSSAGQAFANTNNHQRDWLRSVPFFVGMGDAPCNHFPAFVEICHICNFPHVTNFSSSFFRGIIIIRRGNLPFSNLSAAIACQPPPQSA